MKKISAIRTALAVTLILTALLAGCSSDPANVSASGEKASAPSGAHWTDGLTPLSVQQVKERIAAAKGKALLICLWSVNCPACVQELPVLEELADQLSPDEAEILLLNLDMDKTLVRSFFKEYEPAATVLLVEPAVGDELRAVYIPKLLLYDAKGEIVFEDSGFYPKEMLAALIKRATAAN
ncbi:MAG: TlpA family protein disulfide reductase [Desulfovibrio sp.]